MKKSIIAAVASVLGIGTGAALDDKVMDVVVNHRHPELVRQHELSSHKDTEVSVTPQCHITVRVDEQFINDYCESRRP